MASYLYIHIPFCTKKCSYCDFYSIPYTPELAERYVFALCKEILFEKGIIEKLKTIYIGGGTPSKLREGALLYLLKTIKDNCWIDKDAEITIEVNPEGINEKKADEILAIGINRISIGVQSFLDDDLLILGRSHTASQAQQAIKIIKKAGFKNLSIDLIFGIPKKASSNLSPDRELELWQYSLTKAVELNPQHISVYEFTPEKNTPIYNDIMSRKILIHDENILSEMYYMSKDILERHGYIHYEISNYTKPGYECLHNINYWSGYDYLGIGAGAHSFIDGVRYSNIKDVTEYIANVENGKKVVERVHLSSQDRLEELIFLGLRKIKGIEIERIPDESLKRMQFVINDLILYNLIELKDNHLRLSKKGLILSSEVMVRLMGVF